MTRLYSGRRIAPTSKQIEQVDRALSQPTVLSNCSRQFYLIADIENAQIPKEKA